MNFNIRFEKPTETHPPNPLLLKREGGFYSPLFLREGLGVSSKITIKRKITENPTRHYIT